MKQLAKDQAIRFHDSGIWEDMSLEDVAKFQIQQDCLCVPFGKFHEAVEKTLGRPVYTHEFALNMDGIKAELLDGADPPTLDEILNMIPEEKRIVILTK